MKIGVLGTGMVGATIGKKLCSLGHTVKMGSRTANNEKALAWLIDAGQNASQGTFAEAAEWGDIIFNCTNGGATLAALNLAGKKSLEGKILIDLANPLVVQAGQPISLAVCNTDSLAEQLQAAFPDARVVKTLNTMNCKVMVNPSLVAGEHDVFLCGNDTAAKNVTVDILKSFGWAYPIDLGDLTAARGMEMVLPLWAKLWGSLGSPNFNFHIAR